ncbi:MAG: T9SS type A sorting domain-containing protein, partial [Schleiferiaceae bacterium]
VLTAVPAGEAYTLRWTDASGALLLERQGTGTGQVTVERFDLHDWPNGLYFVERRSAGAPVTQRVVKF